MDHESALAAANQALGGKAGQGASRFASVELQGVPELGRTSREPRGVDESALPSGAWELCAMISVGLVTLALIVTLWLL